MRIRRRLVAVALVLVTSLGVGMMPSSSIQSQAAAKPKIVKSLSVSKKKLSLKVGATAEVNATVKATKKTAGKTLKVSVKSSDKKVATVKVIKSPAAKKAKSGVTKFKVTAKKAGTATITVTTNSVNSKKKAVTKTFKVTVKGGKDVNTATPAPENTATPAPENTAKPTPEEKKFMLRTKDGSTELTKDNQIIELQMDPNTKPYSGVATLAWYKDKTLITKESLKYDTVVDKTSLYVTEPGDYYLEASTSDGTYKTETFKITSKLKVSSDVVEWKTESEVYEGQWAFHDAKSGRDYIYPIKLKRELVSFKPWPTTVEQVEYVIKNCKDPYVIGALYVVALDNYNYVPGQTGIEKRGITSIKMLNALNTGAFLKGLDLTQLGVQPSEKSTIQTSAFNELGKLPGEGGAFSGKTTTDKENGYVYMFAARTYLDGATAENGYAPNGNPADIADKTKWKIIVDTYPYCMDQVSCTSDDADPKLKQPEGKVEIKVKEKGSSTYTTEEIDASELTTLRKDPTFITVCPRRFTLVNENGEGVDPIPAEHNQSKRVGLMFSSKSGRWVSTDYANMNKYEHNKIGQPAHYPFQGQGWFSDNYVAPAVETGF